MAIHSGILRPTADEALAAWRALVEANREQVERLREDERHADFWAPRAQRFRPAMAQAPPPGFDGLLDLAAPGATWLDIGAGGGRYALPLARRVRRVIAVEPSPSMRTQLAAAAAEAGVTNIELIDLRWPPGEPSAVPAGDVALSANVIYDIDDVGGFLLAMERHAARCAVIIGDRAPGGALADLWPAVHGEPQATLPALPELLAVLGALGRRFEVRTFDLPSPAPLPLDDAVAAARFLCWTAEGTAKDARLRATLAERFGDPGSGLVRPPSRMRFAALVTWLA